MGRKNSGRGGVPPEKRAEIDRLVKSGEWQNTQIAAICGVNVSTVYRRTIKLKTGTLDDDELTVRCPKCGGSIPVSEHYCRLCFVRGLKDRERQRL